MSLTLLQAILDARVRRAGLWLSLDGRLITVHDGTMPGLSFTLPLDTPLERIAIAALNGAHARRAFIHGIQPSTRSAA